MNQYSADYRCEVINGVVVIFDLDKGNPSVTNDIRRVLRRVSRDLGGIGRRPIIYRDSTKTFDGVLHDSGDFEGLYSIGETVLEQAISKARAHETNDTSMLAN